MRWNLKDSYFRRKFQEWLIGFQPSNIRRRAYISSKDEHGRALSETRDWKVGTNTNLNPIFRIHERGRKKQIGQKQNEVGLYSS